MTDNIYRLKLTNIVKNSLYTGGFSQKGIQVIEVQPNEIYGPDQSSSSFKTPLTVFGKSVKNYGEIEQENFIRLLEHFSSITPPLQPAVGQLWYDCSEPEFKKLKVCIARNMAEDGSWSGEWVIVGGPGPRGPRGPQGPQGPSYENTTPGPMGPTGNIGPTGPRGGQGAVGPKGQIGPTGNVGPKGPKGQKGPAAGSTSLNNATFNQLTSSQASIDAAVLALRALLEPIPNENLQKEAGAKFFVDRGFEYHNGILATTMWNNAIGTTYNDTTWRTDIYKNYVVSKLRPILLAAQNPAQAITDGINYLITLGFAVDDGAYAALVWNESVNNNFTADDWRREYAIIVGPAGLGIGPTGPTGQSGNAGPTGPAGDPGGVGSTGPTGAPGPTGPQGQNGATSPLYFIKTYLTGDGTSASKLDINLPNLITDVFENVLCEDLSAAINRCSAGTPTPAPAPVAPTPAPAPVAPTPAPAPTPDMAGCELAINESSPNKAVFTLSLTGSYENVWWDLYSVSSSPVNSSDFTSGSSLMFGSATIGDIPDSGGANTGEGLIYITVPDLAAEGVEKFKIRMFSDSARTALILESAVVCILDDSSSVPANQSAITKTNAINPSLTYYINAAIST